MTERHSAGTLPARLTLTEAAARLGVKEQTMRRWRCYDTGPKSYRIGNRVYYDADDLDAWEAAQKARTERGGAA